MVNEASVYVPTNTLALIPVYITTTISNSFFYFMPASATEPLLRLTPSSSCFSRNGRHRPSGPPPMRRCSYPGCPRCAAIETTDQSGVSREMYGSKYERVSLIPFEWSMHGTCSGDGEGEGEGEGRVGLE